jgi:hypothetical protein
MVKDGLNTHTPITNSRKYAGKDLLINARNENFDINVEIL